MIINQENSGLSAARNRGLTFANGKYISYIDSDDFTETDTLENVVCIADKNDLDAVVYGFNRISETGEILPHPFKDRKMKEASEILSGVEYMKRAKNAGVYKTTVWATLWRRDFLLDNGLQFVEGIIYEDNLFSFQAYMAAKKVLYIPDKYYSYRIRKGSISKTPVTTVNSRSFFACAEGVLSYAFHGSYTADEEHEIHRMYATAASLTNYFYNALPQHEKAKMRFSREIEEELFKQIIARYQVDKLQKELTTERIRADRFESDFNCIRHSISFRIGRAITWLPRKIRGGVRCYRENGLEYTVRRAIERWSKAK